MSVSAAVATAALGARRAGRPLFDSRALVLPDAAEAANYFVWRQRDAIRNSVAMAAQSCFPHQRLHGVTTARMRELLHAEAGISWEDYPAPCRLGQVAIRRSGEKEVSFVSGKSGLTETATAVRSWWEVEAAPRFTLDPGGFLASLITPAPATSVGAED